MERFFVVLCNVSPTKKKMSTKSFTYKDFKIDIDIERRRIENEIVQLRLLFSGHDIMSGLFYVQSTGHGLIIGDTLFIQICEFLCDIRTARY